MSVETLFKYGRLNNFSQSLFSTSTIWLPSPNQLNDPFECHPVFTFNGSAAQIKAMIVRGAQLSRPSIPPANALKIANEIFNEGRHKNRESWEAIARDILRALRNDIGVYCMSRNSNNILMWSHYAADHTGYCIEFEATDYTPVFGTAQAVSYESARPIVDMFNTPSEEQARKSMLTKFKDWAYEEEWRIVDTDLGPGLHSYPAELLRSVTFGCRMQESDQAKIRSWVAARGHPARFFVAAPDAQNYEMAIREVT